MTSVLARAWPEQVGVNNHPNVGRQRVPLKAKAKILDAAVQSAVD
jgi:hypothetical protein